MGANVAGNTATDVIARVLRLAAYLKKRGDKRVTLASICADVPGYEANFDADGSLVPDATWEAVRKKLRDLELLESAFGIECDYDTDRAAYSLRPPFFTGDERDVLVAAAALVHVDGVDDAQLAAIGTAVDEHGQRVVMRVHRHVLALRDALAARRPVAFRYHGVERIFDPWAVGLWRDRWYTVGFAHDARERRVFRLDRIEDRERGPSIAAAETDELRGELTPCKPETIGDARQCRATGVARACDDCGSGFRPGTQGRRELRQPSCRAGR